MQVENQNNVKIYNLSSGKSVAEWISERKRRLLQKKDADIRRRIVLIQDFEMPGVSTGIKVSKDGQYILATGVYKPRIRCFDVNNLSMKFERCFNSEAVQFLLLSDDYSKIVLLQCDRNIEFHAQYGCYYRVRIPKFGHDMAYHQGSCDLYFVGASSEVYRLNLEQGRFLNSLQTDASSINKCVINPVHELIAFGTADGKVEAWDPRDRHRVGVVDCAVSSITESTVVDGFPSVTALQFKDAVTMAVGTSTGQVLLYDIRFRKPFRIKDHMDGLPIKNVDFLRNKELVASMNSQCLKFWEEKSGKPYTAICPPADLNDMCFVPNTGVVFLANEDKKILTYYIPSIDRAPSWCSFLDSITEELEESSKETVYDDYKFVTKKELEELGLTHLDGSKLLRSYMHGYFMDIRLYNKVKAIVQPFAYREFQNKKIQEKIEMERRNKFIRQRLPAVNKELAAKLMENKLNNKDGDSVPTILDDERFKVMFEDPDFKIDESSEEYNHIRPLLTKLEKSNKKKATIPFEKFQIVEDKEKSDSSSSSSSEEGEEEDSNSESDMELEKKTTVDSRIKKPKFYEIKSSEKFSMLKKNDPDKDDSKLTLGERLKGIQKTTREEDSSHGNKMVTFTLKKPDSQKKREQQNKQHLKERSKFRRSAKHLR